MAGLSDFGKRIGAVAKSATQKTNELVEITKVNSEVSKLKADIQAKFKDLGQTYYQNFNNDPIPELKEIIMSIQEMEKKVSELEEHILFLKDLVKCPGCGAEINRKDNKFCNKCGKELPELEQKSNQDL